MATTLPSAAAPLRLSSAFCEAQPARRDGCARCALPAGAVVAAGKPMALVSIFFVILFHASRRVLRFAYTVTNLLVTKMPCDRNGGPRPGAQRDVPKLYPERFYGTNPVGEIVLQVPDFAGSSWWAL